MRIGSSAAAIVLVICSAMWSSGASAVVERTSAPAAAAPRWQWPLSPARVVAAYAAPPSPYAAGHRGIDLAAVPGSPVVAPAAATVRFAGVVVDRPVVTLDHGGGVLSSFEPVALDGLREGDPVAPGQAFGVVASGAHCSDACVHVGVRIDGAYVSPLLFFDRVPRSVLLPLRGRATPPVTPGDARSGRSP